MPATKPRRPRAATTTARRPRPAVETLADLFRALGGVSAERVRLDPPLGTATAADVVRLLHAADKRVCELVDGTLVEKAMSFEASYIALLLGRLVGNYVEANGDFGIVAGADGGVRFAKGLVRFPDVSFVRLDRLPGGVVPRAGLGGGRCPFPGPHSAKGRRALGTRLLTCRCSGAGRSSRHHLTSRAMSAASIASATGSTRRRCAACRRSSPASPDFAGDIPGPLGFPGSGCEQGRDGRTVEHRGRGGAARCVDQHGRRRRARASRGPTPLGIARRGMVVGMGGGAALSTPRRVSRPELEIAQRLRVRRRPGPGAVLAIAEHVPGHDRTVLAVAAAAQAASASMPRACRAPAW